MQLIDLCSGIGGFSLAAHWIGWSTIAFCEKDKFCQKVLEKNFPGVPIYDDIFTFPSESFQGQSDTILSAGFPCQPFSQAGKQLGRDDERHLFPKILEIVASIRPAICVFENVRGLLSIESGQVFAEIITSLEGQGYEVITFCIPASALNAPHRRDRLWIVAHAIGERERSGSGEIRRTERGQVERVFSELSNTDRDTRHSESNASDTFGQIQERPEPITGRSYAFDTNSNQTGERGLRERETAAHSGDSVRYRPNIDTKSIGQQWSLASSSLELARGERNDSPITGNGGSCDEWRRNWTDIAARTCIRRVDAGASAELDIVGARDNRVARLKALGNAIVPQIAFEIFKAIDETQTQN